MTVFLLLFCKNGRLPHLCDGFVSLDIFLGRDAVILFECPGESKNVVVSHGTCRDRNILFVVGQKFCGNFHPVGKKIFAGGDANTLGKQCCEITEEREEVAILKIFSEQCVGIKHTHRHAKQSSECSNIKTVKV